jgi:succinoglycan biosynthesis transport protein ExoP
MQPQDSLSVTRRSLDVEDYIDILRRHKAWILGPTFAALVASVVVAFLWPDTYLSAGIIRVVPPQVPESYVPSNLNTDLQGRINQISQLILNRSTLTAMVNTFDLYKKERSRLPMDDIIENMRQHDIKIGMIQTFGQLGNKQSVPAFQVGFQYSNRMVAQKVASDLIAKFLTGSQAATTDMTQSTTLFLQQSREAAKKKLDEVEGRLSAFQARNIGHLPEQTGINYQQLNATQAQMLNLNSSMSRVNQEKLLLENQMHIYREQMLALKDPTPQDQASQKKNEKLAEKDREITYYENALAAARERYSESHPDVQALSTKLATVKKQRETIVKEEETKKPDQSAVVTPRAPNPEFVKTKNDLNVAIQRLQALIEAKDLEMQDYQKQVAQFNGQMKSLQDRLQGMPVGLREYGELIRDQELAKRDFEDLDKKVNSSDLATKVINRQQGEKLELLEEASTPQTPTEPRRSIIVLAGTGLGLLVGIFLAGARELRNSALKNLKDVRAYTQLPILGSIPLLENDLVVRRRRRLAWLAWSTACMVGIVVMSSSVVYYYATKL